MKEYHAIMIQLLYVIAEALIKDKNNARFKAAKNNYKKVMVPALEKYKLNVADSDQNKK